MVKLTYFLTLGSLLLLVLMLVPGCGDGVDRREGQVRFFNAIPDSPKISISLDGSAPRELGYGEFSDYYALDIDSSADLRVFVPSGPVAILQRAVNVLARRKQTIAIVPPAELDAEQGRYNVSTVELTDLSGPRRGDRFLVRVVHLAPSAPPLDLVLADPRALPGVISSRVEDVSFRSNTGYLEGNLEHDESILSLQSSDTGEVLYTSEPLSFDSHTVSTFYVLDRPQRGLPVVVVVSIDSDF